MPSPPRRPRATPADRSERLRRELDHLADVLDGTAPADEPSPADPPVDAPAPRATGSPEDRGDPPSAPP